MSAEFFIPNVETEKLFNSVAAVTSQTVPELLRDVMKLWVKDLVRQTYPKSKRQMSKRIQSETSALFLPNTELESDSLRLAFKKGQKFVVGGKMRLAPNMGGDEMLQTRNRLRNAKGRVPRRPGVVPAVVRSGTLKRHIRAVASRIGRLKGGWANAAKWAGVAVPSWAPRGMDGGGTFSDDIKTKGLEGHLEAGNTVPYASTKLNGQFMDYIMRKRFRDLSSGKYAKRWKKKMEARTA